MKLKIKTLTPLHIGSGEKYNALSYIKVKENNKHYLCYLDFDKVKQVLTTEQLNTFFNWISEQEYPSLQEFLNEKLRDHDGRITKQLISESIYKVELCFNEDPTKKTFLGDIESFIKQNNMVYIPGSEIKGAIRTAVMYKLLNDDTNTYEWLKKEIENLGRKKEIEINEVKNSYLDKQKSKIKLLLSNEMRKIEEEIHHKVFNPPNKTTRYDAKYDLLKFLHISDTDSKKPQDCLFIAKIETINISRKFNIFQELLKEGQEFTIHEFAVNKNDSVVNTLGFSDNQKKIISFEKILECCYEFTNKVIKEEENYFKNNKNILEELENIKESNEKNSPVIRIGKNEGFLSVTIGLLIKEKSPNLYNDVLIHTTKGKSYTNNFPKTRKIINLNGKQHTLGWVKIIPEKDNSLSCCSLTTFL